MERNIGRDTHIKEGVYYIEPELEARIDGDRVIVTKRESEDERVRQMIENTLRDAVLSERVSETSYREMSTYLEKQKDAFQNGVEFGIMQEQARVELEGSKEHKDASKAIKALYIPKFREGDMVVSTRNNHLTYRILNVGSINELGNPEYKVEIFTDDKPGILRKEHNIQSIEIEKMDEWGELMEQKPNYSLGEFIDDFPYSDEQKEQKLLECDGIGAAIMSALASGIETDEILNARGFTYDDVERYLVLREQKPADLQNCIDEYQKRMFSQCPKDESPVTSNQQKPAEWSEEDEKNWNEYIGRLKSEYRKTPNVVLWDDINWLEALHKRLKSLRPSWKPSELEKGALRTAIHLMTEERSFPKAAAQLQNIINAFEGKESRNDWKPSEEQMSALYTYIYNPQYFSNPDPRMEQVISIYNDLKKLMEDEK